MSIRSQFLWAAGLVGLCVIGRLEPHIANVAPVAAPALFAGWLLQNRVLALSVPLLGMALSDFLLQVYQQRGYQDIRVLLIVYVAYALPAFAGRFLGRGISPLRIGLFTIACAFVINETLDWSVWQFETLYPYTLAGLGDCLVAGLPYFLRRLAGDLVWATILFGSFAAVPRLAPTFQREHGYRPESAPASASAEMVQASVPETGIVRDGLGSRGI